MKTKLFSLGLAALSLALNARAQLPTFKTLSNTNATSAQVVFQQQPTSQIRLVSAILSSDSATSTLVISTGTTSHYTAATNSTSGTNIVLESTNGLTSTSQVYVQTPTGAFVMTANSIQTNGLGFATVLSNNVPLNCEVELLTNSVTFATGAATNKVFASDGLFVGNYGRAVVLTQTGTTIARIDAATAHYDATSQ